MSPLTTLGLWGDGDELWAIEDAFKEIELEVPIEDASTWITVGDLWASAKRVSPGIANQPQAWDNFRCALADETGVDRRNVSPETTLIDGRGHNILSRLLTTLREKLSA